MSQNPETIRQEMDETRNSLTDKISQLEQQVADTVHDASSSVKETVAAVKEAVQETVLNVKETVGETVDSVKETFCIRSQVEKRPWTMMAAGAGAGFAVGYFVAAPSAPETKPSAPTAFTPRKKHGNGSHRERLAGSEERQREAPGGSALASLFENELAQLKALALGALGGVVRDLIVGMVPEMMRKPITEIVDNATTKLGGQPIEGKIFGGGGDQRSDDPGEREGERGTASGPFPKRQTTLFHN